MSRREATLKALGTLRNTDDTQSIASDDDDNFLDGFDENDADVDEDSNERDIFLKKKREKVDDTNQQIIDLIESSINRLNDDQNLNKTSKIGIVWQIFLTSKNLKFVDVNLTPPVLRGQKLFIFDLVTYFIIYLIVTSAGNRLSKIKLVKKHVTHFITQIRLILGKYFTFFLTNLWNGSNLKPKMLVMSLPGLVENKVSRKQ
ncbi:hypothetical protein BpHYR1_030466 [Brachionus plicatilis]|uniref:Uncharacterized protein n=1 Tax=Brachionus plicatilis TaxID=10195 RepID=A0A3M7RX58_BRAPC|nr:hypothetical protein BpHYR1_030466 [Brachionus plicatilis]